MFKKSLIAASAICLALTGASTVGTRATADTKDKKIVLSNSFAGNPWRQAMLGSWKKTGDQAVKDGVVASADAFTTAGNLVTEQSVQLQNLIREGYNAIVIDAASADGLNADIKQACDAGIVVVSFDGIVNEPCAYRIMVDYEDMGAAEVKFIAQKLPQGGNVLEIRGEGGTAMDDAIHAGIDAELQKTPQLKSVGSVHGDWDEDQAQKAVSGVLTSLPEIKAVVTQGGDGYGVAQAFKDSGRPTPLIIMGNRYEDLQWWKDQNQGTGYETMSVSIAPGMSTLAFWIAQQILDGAKVPHDLVVPYLRIDQKDLDDAIKATPKGSVYNTDYTLDDAKQVIADQH